MYQVTVPVFLCVPPMLELEAKVTALFFINQIITRQTLSLPAIPSVCDALKIQASFRTPLMNICPGAEFHDSRKFTVGSLYPYRPVSDLYRDFKLIINSYLFFP